MTTTTETSPPAAATKIQRPRRRPCDASLAVFVASAVISVVLYRWGSAFEAAIALSMCVLLTLPSSRLLFQPPRSVTDFSPPSRPLVRLLAEPWTWLFPIKSRNLHRIPTTHTRLLFVGNHQTFALDIPCLFSHLYATTGIYVRGLADRIHFQIPLWSSFLTHFGGVNGTRPNCAALMRENQPICVFPGGSDEVLRAKDVDPYALLWGKRAGFAKMAAEHGYVIVPFASVGIVDAFKIWFDLPVGLFYALLGDPRATRSTPTAPSPTVPVPSPFFFKPQAAYLWFGEPIDCSAYDPADEAAVFALRERVRMEVERGIAECREWQRTDPGRFHSVWKRVGVAVEEWWRGESCQ
ncbi:Transmembrane protein 68 [Phlyctochytrium bullatum]|nr:Transmembrane protein 68 [Phlyctochytrium bullatum]